MRRFQLRLKCLQTGVHLLQFGYLHGQLMFLVGNGLVCAVPRQCIALMILQNRLQFL